MRKKQHGRRRGEGEMREKRRVRNGERRERLREEGRAELNGNKKEEERWRREARMVRLGMGKEGLGRLAKLIRSMRLR